MATNSKQLVSASLDGFGLDGRFEVTLMKLWPKGKGSLI